MKKHILSALATAALLAVAAPAALAQNVAIVNGKAVPTARLDALTQQVARSGREITPDLQTRIREQVIHREVFAQEAQARGLDATDEFKAQVELARQAILISELFTDFQKKNAVTDAEVQAEYDKFVASNAGKEYRARHILVEDEKQALSLIAQIKKGAKFEVLAKKFSKDPGSGANGGDLDWANPSSYVQEFTAALLTLSKGQMTDKPVKSQFGYHIIRLDDVREAKLPKLEDVKKEIAQQLLQQKVQAFQTNLLSKAKIE